MKFCLKHLLGIEYISPSEIVYLLDRSDQYVALNRSELKHSEINDGLTIIDALAGKTNFLKSHGEAKRALKENSISVNKEKVNEEKTLNASDLINNRYILIQRGKKNYFVIYFN